MYEHGVHLSMAVAPPPPPGVNSHIRLSFVLYVLTITGIATEDYLLSIKKITLHSIFTPWVVTSVITFLE